MRFMHELAIIIALILGAATQAYCESAPPLAAGQALAHKKSGDIHLAGGRVDEAAAEYEKAVVLNPELSRAYFNLAIASYALGDLDQAIEALERVVELDENDAEALYNLGCLYLYKNNLTAARRFLVKARECCDSQPRFKPLVDKGLGFLETLQSQKPEFQRAVLTILQLGALTPQHLPDIGVELT